LHILQSNNGAEFTASIISQLKDLWPECKIVHGMPRHPQSQGNVERANTDIKDMTVSIMSKSFLNPVFVISLRSFSVLIFEMISSGKEDEVRPTFASTPNIALYGVRLIPEW
jgi:hypothetical protein